MSARRSSWLQSAMCGIVLLSIGCEKKDSQLTPADSSPALLQVEQGSIEDRIQTLQQRKSALADAVLGHDTEQASKFSLDELNALLAPLEDPQASHVFGAL